jgi:hypothetical protein
MVLKEFFEYCGYGLGLSAQHNRSKICSIVYCIVVICEKARTIYKLMHHANHLLITDKEAIDDLELYRRTIFIRII